MKKRRKRRKRKSIPRPLLIFLLILLFVLGFLGFFHVSDERAEVVGSTRYTAGEVRAMVLDSFRNRNSLYLAYVQKEVRPGNAPFIDSIEIRYKSHNRVTLQVVENNPVGYLVQGDNNYYFDADGMVLESIPSRVDSNGVAEVRPEAVESVTASSTETAETTPVPSEDALTAVEVQPEEQPQALTAEAVTADSSDGSLQAVAQQSSDTDFHPALTDVTQVEGLTDEEVKVGGMIRANDRSVFSSIYALSKIISKLGIKPDYIAVDESSRFTLYYGDIVVKIGKDTLMEEKMARAAAILPKLEGMKGTLHLENYGEDTVNIVFDKANS
ncbi:MAG: hypothetical protein Q4B22_02550 [Eubacteriales bacterium]|nr:hypothetical protein [Eubacteriales bacterium]